MRTLHALLVAAIVCGGCSANRSTSVQDRGGAAGDSDLRSEAVADVARAVEAAEPIDPTADPADPQAPSIDGFDRSHWPTVVVHPESGAVHHSPAYLGGRAQTTLDGVDVAEFTADQRVELALGPAYGGSALSRALWEPLRTGGQIVMLPFTLVTQPPGSDASSGVRAPGPATAGSVSGRLRGRDLSPGSPGRGAGPGFGGGAGGTGGGVGGSGGTPGGSGGGASGGAGGGGR